MRENGYYWCLFTRDNWVISYWNGDFWELMYNIFRFKDEDFDEIDEKQIKRE